MQKRHKVLITGSAGMLGIDLCQELKWGYDIYGLDILKIKVEAARVKRFFKCDITDRNSVVEVMSKVAPDVVIHTAAWTDVDGCEADRDRALRINSEGTKNVALACGRNNAVLIYISTDFVFDGKKRNPYKESDRPNPINAYGDSKLKGEDLIRRHLKRHFIIRTSWLYGRHGKNFVDTILSKARDDRALKVVNDQTGSPTYTKDLAKALRVLTDQIFTDDSPKGTGYGTYHVSNSGSVSWYGYAKEILRVAGSGTKVTPISSAEFARPARRPVMSVLDSSKFIRYTGHRMRSWKDTVAEYLSAFGARNDDQATSARNAG